MRDRTGEPNGSPVNCSWCDKRLASYAAYKVQMAAHDEYDYNWACETCYEKVWE